MPEDDVPAEEMDTEERDRFLAEADPGFKLETEVIVEADE